MLGRVVRFALWVGTEVVFSPVRHPESNGYVERFHQEYDRHVWRDTYLADLAEVRRAATEAASPRISSKARTGWKYFTITSPLRQP